MKFRNKASIFGIVILTVLTISFIYWFSNSIYFSIFNSWILKNILLYSVILYLVKVLGILWPPFSGGLFTIASIPFLGWKLAFLLDFLGSITGGVIAYSLGRKYGYKFLHKLFGAELVQKIKSIKIKAGKEIEAIFMYKVLFGILIEAVYYGAGVLRVNFIKFTIGSILGHLVVGIPSFYLAGNLFSGKDFMSTIALTILAIIFVTKTKGRYFE